MRHFLGHPLVIVVIAVNAVLGRRWNQKLTNSLTDSMSDKVTYWAVLLGEIMFRPPKKQDSTNLSHLDVHRKYRVSQKMSHSEFVVIAASAAWF